VKVHSGLILKHRNAANSGIERAASWICPVQYTSERSVDLLSGMIGRHTRNAISWFIHGLSWLATVLAVLAAALWLGVVLARDGAVGFLFLLIAPFLSGGSLLLGVIPSGVLYFQKRQRRDWLSLWLSGSSCLSVAGEWVVLGCCRISAC
jgi:hypothetical protein